MGLARYVYYGWDFRMIIMETVGIAYQHFASGEAAGYFTVEGRIRDQFYYGGQYWDGISVTHRRDQFEKVMQDLKQLTDRVAVLDRRTRPELPKMKLV